MTCDVLVTGACGMIGSHLAERLFAEGRNVLGTFYKPTIDLEELSVSLLLQEMDIRYNAHVTAVIAKAKPSTIFHLAAQSYPTLSWARPEETLATNVIGTMNIFEAVKAIRRTDSSYDPTIVTACSSAEYGSSLLLSDEPVKEDAQLLPLHPYGVSKVATDLLSYQYFKSDGIRAIRARIFNTSGPRKQGDVISDFARRVAKMSDSGDVLRVGNLTSRRAYLHVADTVSALLALANNAEAGEAYNISGTEVVSVLQLLPLFEEVSGHSFKTLIDTTLLRPTDEPIIWGDISKIRAHTGWKPTHAVLDIVRDVFHYELNKVLKPQVDGK